ncbi:hypothetical protein Tco_0120141, partial [Tanacetum coccineum]
NRQKDTKENSNLIKEIRASTDAAIRNQGASIKTNFGDSNRANKQGTTGKRICKFIELHGSEPERSSQVNNDYY